MVEAKDIRTYESGPAFMATCDLTKADFIGLCVEMGCVPEPITGGGLLFTDRPDSYKTIRLRLKSWPWINGDEMETWENDEDVLIEKGTTFQTFLKAFYEAPAWSKEEIQRIEFWMREYGIVKKGSARRIYIKKTG